MRKLLMILTITVSYLAATGAASAAGAPPACDPDCPWVR
jgi:hypothetical protein